MWLRRLSEFIAPTDSELAALEEAKDGRREFKRNQMISQQGNPTKEIYFVADGWIGASLEVNFGCSQLAKIYLPGDFAGLPNIATSCAVENLVALTNITLDVIPLDRLSRLFERAPRFGFMLFVTTQQERVMLMDHLAVVGQSSAIQRVAALLIHVYRRLLVLRPEAGRVIDWPLSQQRVAQGAGLSAIHVNRTFAELTRRGLIAREGKRIRLLDLECLSELAGLPERPTVREPRWLSACRMGGN
jgi:CRP/FNR family transcriptional regulator